MSWNSKVIWTEGMLLQPQHFQQHDRFMAARLEARVMAMRPFSWGFTSLQLDDAQLAFGRIALLACSGVMPDGTPFQLPLGDPLPLPLEVPGDLHDAHVVLALPALRPGVIETSDDPDGNSHARHSVENIEIWDSNGLQNSAHLQVGRLRFRLAVEKDVANAYTCLPVAQVVERLHDGKLLLDPDFCPPCLDYRVSPRLSSWVDEILGLLHQRGETLAARIAQPAAAGTAEIADFLGLQVVNRLEPLFQHYCSARGYHPVDVYQAMLCLVGELATFGKERKRPPVLPPYRHDRLRDCARPVYEELRRLLSTVMDSHAVPIKLEERQFGLRVAVVKDSELIKTARFILAVNADMPAESVRTGFPPKVKIGAVEKIRDLVNLQLPGVILHPLPVAPRQLPFHAGYTYFELERAGDDWQALENSAGFALHVAGEFPGLKMEFWAIRK